MTLHTGPSLSYYKALEGTCCLNLRSMAAERHLRCGRVNMCCAGRAATWQHVVQPPVWAATGLGQAGTNQYSTAQAAVLTQLAATQPCRASESSRQDKQLA